MTAPTPVITIVSPVYKAEDIVHELVKRIQAEVSVITEKYEIILIEDGSPDCSWKRIEECCRLNQRVKGIKLSRNFGQHYAISAGLAEARGDYVVVMDCDLQDNPKYIKELFKKSQEGFDIVYTVKKHREHNPVKNVFAGLFHHLFNWLIGNKHLHSSGRVGAYSLITRKVVDAYCSVNDYYRPYLTILQWLGFSTTYIEIEHERRFAGSSSYTPFKLIGHALNGIVSQTDRLLKLSIYTGMGFALMSIISIVYIIIQTLFKGSRPGWPSLASLILFSTACILINFGVVGLYIGKLFEQTKRRPLYVIDKKVNLNDSGKDRASA